MNRDPLPQPALRLTAEAVRNAPPPLSIRTLPIDAQALGLYGPHALIDLLTGHRDVVSWVRHGRGLVGFGRCLEMSALGADRCEVLRAAWRAIIYASWWSDPLVRPGTGPVAAGTITFAESSTARSVLIVPRILIGLDEAGAWLTTAVPHGEAHPETATVLAELHAGRREPGTPDGDAQVETGSRTEAEYLAIVDELRRRMRAGEADKVVLARDALVRPGRDVAAGTLLARLARAYPTCWTFGVDSMIGASPEPLLRLEGRRLRSRVLAGTARRRGEDAAQVIRLGAWLEASDKNVREHDFARASALAALTPLCSVVEAGERFVLTLPNVLHLASDISGVVAGDTGALSLVRALHPTAAVGGTPTGAALALIAELEGLDRERYAGPVGWVDWHGEGEWCIALRSAALAAGVAGPRSPARVFGGGGILPESQPEDELAETWAKMRPMLAAFGAVPDRLNP